MRRVRTSGRGKNARRRPRRRWNLYVDWFGVCGRAKNGGGGADGEMARAAQKERSLIGLAIDLSRGPLSLSFSLRDHSSRRRRGSVSGKGRPFRINLWKMYNARQPRAATPVFGPYTAIELPPPPPLARAAQWTRYGKRA